MDVRPRGSFLTCAGLLFASIGFTLSVLSTLLRLLVPFYPSRGADATSTIRRSTIHRRVHSKRSSRRSAPSTTTVLSISSYASTSSSSEESNTPPPRRHPKASAATAHRRRPRSLERTITSREDPPLQSHSRVLSEHVDRPDFRTSGTQAHSRRRSESLPPSPAPWAAAHDTNPAGASTGPSHSREESASIKPTFHLPRAPSMDSSVDDHPATKSSGLSFLHRKKVHKAPSVPAGFFHSKLSPPPPVPPVPDVHKRKSQLFGQILPKRRSMHESDVHAPAAPTRRFSGISISSTEEAGEDGTTHTSPTLDDLRASFESHSTRSSQDTVRCSQDSWHAPPQPKRSQTLRTRPYEAPYFFPAPGSVEAAEYLPPLPRQRPVRSGTLPVRPVSDNF